MLWGCLPHTPDREPPKSTHPLHFMSISPDHLSAQHRAGAQQAQQDLQDQQALWRTSQLLPFPGVSPFFGVAAKDRASCSAARDILEGEGKTTEKREFTG